MKFVYLLHNRGPSSLRLFVSNYHGLPFETVVPWKLTLKHFKRLGTNFLLKEETAGRGRTGTSKGKLYFFLCPDAIMVTYAARLPIRRPVSGQPNCLVADLPPRLANLFESSEEKLTLSTNAEESRRRRANGRHRRRRQ